MQVVIHLGYHKTGTTFFQNQIFNRLTNVNLIRTATFYAPLDDKKLNIISDETLSGSPYVLSNALIRFDIADRLKLCYPKAKIILGIRDNDAWLKSLYSQFIRNGGIYDFKEWLDKVVDKDYLDHHIYISYLHQLWRDVYVFKFEDFCQDKNKIIREMCDFIGCEIPEYHDVKYNTKLSPRRLELIRFLNKFWESGWNPRGKLPYKPFFNPEFFGEFLDLKRIIKEGKDKK
jgi:hypothetical protein